ncbi:DUF4942 domain-containing protein [Salmonella enterica subsp. enterica serovar Berlin]|nr:DUF4942 domain-containing protein [Salmonella enterica]EBY0805253.1 DUF4942 domain-containing protein [Salmonella enterica subsp. enterica serovar Berlin]
MSHHDPEVLTGNTEVISSTSIERIVTGRNVALEQIKMLIRQLGEISQLTSVIGGGTSNDWAMREGHLYGSWLIEPPETAMEAITRNIDRSIWRDLMGKSGMISLMDAEARDQWYNSLGKDDIPAISEANILSTFEQLHQSKAEVFERGVINVFKGLSWDYKSNSPCKFGKKVILEGLVQYDRWGFHFRHGRRRDQLSDLDRMLNLLDGRPVPENRNDLAVRLDAHISKQYSSVFEDEYVEIRYFQKGTGHIIFKRPDLVDKMNDIVARHYPEMLSPGL